MGSTRLPGKVLEEVCGKALLKYQIERVQRATLLDEVVVATSVLAQDDIIAEFCDKHNIACFRGSEDDVLARYYECAKQYGADIIVRLTADCPLLDPNIIDEVVRLFKAENADYASNTTPLETSTFPDGSDVEVFSMAAMERAHKECKDAHDREHVTFYFWKYDNGFRTAQLIQQENWSKYRFTVDYPEDLEVVSFILKEFNSRHIFGHIADIIEMLNSNKEIAQKNAKYYAGIGWEKK